MNWGRWRIGEETTEHASEFGVLSVTPIQVGEWFGHLIHKDGKHMVDFTSYHPDAFWFSPLTDTMINQIESAFRVFEEHQLETLSLLSPDHPPTLSGTGTA